MLEFTRILFELFVKQGLTLSQSLLIMKEKPRADIVSRAADMLYMSLENGSSFSNALLTCKAISFDETYVAFISMSEKSGDLKTALSYLYEKLEREKTSRKKLAGAAVYPVFVVLLSIASSIFIGFYTDTADFPLLMKYIFILIFMSALLFFGIAKMLGENKLFEAFTAIDFLLRNGIELTEALGCAIKIAGPSSKAGKFFENARIRLSYGMDLQNAFLGENDCGVGSGAKLRDAFYYADLGGSKDDLFGRIADCMKSDKERIRTICFSLIEPAFIVLTGGFVLALLITFFMPLINGTEWI